MKKISVIVALLGLLMSGCAVLDAPVGSNPLAAQSAQAMQPVVLEAATMTAQPTVTRTPTISPSPTKIDYGPLPITETAVALERAAIENQRALLQARETGQALDGLAAGATATWAAPTETKAAGSTQTAVAWAEATIRAERTAVADQDISRQLAIMLQRDHAFADWLPWIYGLIIGMVLLLGGLAAAWLRAGYGAKMAERRIYESPVKPLSVSVDRAVTVKIDQRDRYGFGTVDFASLPIDHDTLEAVASLMAQGARYTQAQMTGSAGPLVKDGNYDIFGQWLVDNLIAIRLPDGRYQIVHPEFFEQVLK